MGKHLGRFHLLAAASNAATNIGIQISVQVPAFSSFEYKSRSGIARPCSNSTFCFLRNSRIVFHNNCIILYSYQQGIAQRFLILTNTCYFLFFFYNGNLNVCEVVSCCFGSHFPNDWWWWASIYALAYWLSAYHLWTNVYSSPLPMILIGLLTVFLFLSCSSSLYIMDINALSVIQFAKVFLHSVGYLFTLLILMQEIA